MSITDQLTERQRAALPEAIAEIQQYAHWETVRRDLDHGGWTVQLDPEVRPGRGHHVTATWLGEELCAQIRMDVYGYPAVSVADLTWIHNSSDEDCQCGPCVTGREDEEE